MLISGAKVPAAELSNRLSQFRAVMDRAHPEWELAAFFGRINQYYFTGTMQDGVLLIPRGRDALFCVRRSHERALAESEFPLIVPIKTFRDAAALLPGTAEWNAIHIDVDVVPFGLLQRFRKQFACQQVFSLDADVAQVRSVKSPYELRTLEEAGAIHRHIFEECVPGLLREGMSEAELGCDLYSLMVREGHQGTVRFGMFNVDIAVAQLGFGENSLYPTSFDGPGGCRGIGPAAPVLGSRERKLRKGDLVFVDAGFALEGYHTDKTMVYAFGKAPAAEIAAVHRRCVEIEHEVAAQLRPGAIPAEIYSRTIASLTPEFLENFMGFGARRTRFLGHGVGLQIDEPPVLAEGFEDPLQAGMVFAVEPKKGVPGLGMVGSENTYVVTADGGKSITGSHPGLLEV